MLLWVSDICVYVCACVVANDGLLADIRKGKDLKKAPQEKRMLKQVSTVVHFVLSYHPMKATFVNYIW